MIVAIGKRRLRTTSHPIVAAGLKDEKTPTTIPMHEPAPTSDASNDTPTTSFGRMRTVSSIWMCTLRQYEGVVKKRCQEYHSPPIVKAANNQAGPPACNFLLI